MRILSAYLIGIVFGVGISISGMANPAKVINFFDLAHMSPKKIVLYFARIRVH